MFDLIYEPAPGQQHSLHFDSPLTAVMWLKGKAPINVVEIRERRAAAHTYIPPHCEANLY